ncbi:MULTISPECIES: bifunctional hydroxymethylpyrimidine kinase/phosphomethylpyrimidine kinase [unclassified Ensifer]|uniref:bifunctional hydroxymethylpyrimidine kinase/phosphomethylpyrimidine kinase n=1 Tax=unclassified Ensifer TaxID=2633371 RepID=UPI000812FAF8|nr:MULTISPECIES: bifunctional hydroxymethylpyrimidine kinase/phosphomethylpyrimidine kinase [unclassified Ensifer]OCP00415.1 bifunctional hydroxymethylpyrimidine kinase/phosphomethylpyrimidine kinase [Ensifer sp. LC11]OCP08783.1 bifunctional hydroxymethylpyrimidine kinase/phosphomethylpyrimidine kinase [Ensifer sp. LC13]OCP12476.1 bifunctional hydroxymethylpyrimidine kinase/phosphomethylpyrimidine kinase [Ensifer sp. LC14]OCP29468.1 bifunctional hydroxymethylpyrimidine kinase/phosphomethylpyrim
MTGIAVTIAGSDSGGGAGIQADLKTFSALGVYGASVVTAITAQNTRGVTAVEDISPAVVTAQIDAVFSDLAVGAVKIGMVSRHETIAAIASGLKRYGHMAIIDPVMVATSGDILLRPDAIATLKEELLPLALIVTPNLPEAALMTGRGVAENEIEMARQAEMLLKLGAAAVLMKGGHANGDEAADILFEGSSPLRLSRPRVETKNDHGTGCTLSAAIAAGLAHRLPLEESVIAAKTYLHEALVAGANLKIGQGRGAVHHFHQWWAAPNDD